MVERELWLAVIQQAIRDVMGHSFHGHAKAPWLIRNEAWRWFYPKSLTRHQFEHVCDLAGVDPDVTRRAAAAAIIGQSLKEWGMKKKGKGGKKC